MLITRLWLRAGQHADGAVDFLERHGLVGAGDDDGLVLLGRLLLSESEYRSKHEEKKEKSGMQT